MRYLLLRASPLSSFRLSLHLSGSVHPFASAAILQASKCAVLAYDNLHAGRLHAAAMPWLELPPTWQLPAGCVPSSAKLQENLELCIPGQYLRRFCIMRSTLLQQPSTLKVQSFVGQPKGRHSLHPQARPSRLQVGRLIFVLCRPLQAIVLYHSFMTKSCLYRL